MAIPGNGRIVRETSAERAKNHAVFGMVQLDSTD
jgi:hypothetical protein